MQVRPGCAFVLEWNLPFRNPGSATGIRLVAKCGIGALLLYTVVGVSNMTTT